MRQSSVDEAHPRGGAGARQEREQWLLLYAGLAGALALTLGLWLMRGWIADAPMSQLLVALMTLVGGGIVFSAITALLLFATRVDRSTEEVARGLDAVASGDLSVNIVAAKGLGRAERVAGAAAAAVARLRTWVANSQRAIAEAESELGGTHALIAPLRQSIVSTTARLAQLSRDTHFLAATAEEHGALTQRACVLASMIGQSQRDSAGFGRRVHDALREASASLTECGKRTGEAHAFVSAHSEGIARLIEADGRLSQYLTSVSKTARQFKLLALHAAMEAARAGARADVQQGGSAGGGEFRVVAFEVRKMATDLARMTEEFARSTESTRRSLLALQEEAGRAQQEIVAAGRAVSLGVTSLEHAMALASSRVADDAALSEAGAELTILTSSIRERSTGSAKGTGDVGDRLATLEQSLEDSERATLDLDEALIGAMATLSRAAEVFATVAAAQAAAPVKPAALTVQSEVLSSHRAPPRGRGQAPEAPPPLASEGQT